MYKVTIKNFLFKGDEVIHYEKNRVKALAIANTFISSTPQNQITIEHEEEIYTYRNDRTGEVLAIVEKDNEE